MTLPRTPDPGDEIALMLEAFNHALKTGSAAAMDVAMQLADDNRTRAIHREARAKQENVA